MELSPSTINQTMTVEQARRIRERLKESRRTQFIKQFNSVRQRILEHVREELVDIIQGDDINIVENVHVRTSDFLTTDEFLDLGTELIRKHLESNLPVFCEFDTYDNATDITVNLYPDA